MKALKVVILQDEVILSLLSKMLEAAQKKVREERLLFLSNPCKLIELIRTGERLFVVSGQRGFDLAPDVKTCNPESLFFSYSSDLEMRPHFDGQISKYPAGHLWQVTGFIELVCQLGHLTSPKIMAELKKQSFIRFNPNPA